MAHTVGVSAEPDICKLDLDLDHFDYIIVSASDGLWDALSIEKVKQYVRKIFIRTMAVEDCCTFLARDARLQWLSKDQGSADDITVQMAVIRI